MMFALHTGWWPLFYSNNTLYNVLLCIINAGLFQKQVHLNAPKKHPVNFVVYLKRQI